MDTLKLVNINESDKLLFKLILSASFNPLFETIIINVIFSPTYAVDVFTTCLTSISIFLDAFNCNIALLLELLMSYSSDCADTLFKITPTSFTLEMISKL